jgi:hypothetical protein
MRRPLSKQIFAHCDFGTQPIYLADYIFVARCRGKDVEAFHSGRRMWRACSCGWPSSRGGPGRTGRDFAIIALQEAGLDGFWIYRVLQSEGFESHVVEAASILTARRRRRAKTDGIDGHAFNVQTRGTACVRDGQGTDIRRGGPPPNLPGARDGRWRASGTLNRHQAPIRSRSPLSRIISNSAGLLASVSGRPPGYAGVAVAV